MFFRLKKSGERSYVQIVENKREGAAVRQRVIANLGRADELAASGALASLIASGAKLTDQVLLIHALDEDVDGALSVAAKRIGGPLLFGRHSSDAAIRGHVFCSFLALSMQKHLDDLSREAGLAPEGKHLLRDLDRLAQVRIRHRGADWLLRTDAAASITSLFRRAHVALPPRARQARPPPPQTKPARKRRRRPRRSATST